MCIINYIIVGVIFTFVLDLILHRLRNNDTMVPVIEKWDNMARIACIIVWPIALTVFIYSFAKEFFK